MIDAAKFSVDEARRDLLARLGRPRELDDDLVAERVALAGCERCPVDTGQRDVLPGGAWPDRVPFRLQRPDHLDGVQTQRTLGTAVDLRVRVTVAGKAERPAGGLAQGQLRHAARRDRE